MMRHRERRSHSILLILVLVDVLLRSTRGFTISSGNENPGLHRCLRRPSRLMPLFSMLEEDDKHQEEPETGRRTALKRIVATTGMAATAAVGISPQLALAGKPELDSTTGQLYTPKSEMLSGGSEAARGIPLESPGRGGTRLKPGQALQNVYGTRFIAYLSRFLLNFDPSAHAWWLKKGFGDTWETIIAAQQQQADKTDGENGSDVESAFAEYAESVEVGLADYFVGPYGSYSNLKAAKAGLFASQPAQSKRPEKTKKKKKGMFESRESAQTAKQGILNLYTLLKARYTSLAAKRQLAILFSFISNPMLQPTREIAALLGEADNATVTDVQIIEPSFPINEAESRTSPRRGGGYSINFFPKVLIEPPAALGDDYVDAVVEPVMRLTSRVLRIRVLDGGDGYYDAPPQVRVSGGGGIRRSCQAAAILDREGHVESVLVLDPGFGYGGSKGVPPKIEIQAPRKPRKKGDQNGAAGTFRKATAVAELEYEVARLNIIRGGNGYPKNEPPTIQVTPPDGEDPDWFLAVQEHPELRMVPVTDLGMGTMTAKVAEMQYPDGNVAYSLSGVPANQAEVDDDLVLRLQRGPLELLPSSIRPELRLNPKTRDVIYTIPSMDTIPQFVVLPGARYRAVDPVFGGVGKVPVQKGAADLKPSEYGRLALSGAVCTVLVRTALNPLELIKTKQQLQNDEELLTFVSNKKASAPKNPPDQAIANTAPKVATVSSSGAATAVLATEVIEKDSEEVDEKSSVGTIDLIKGMVELRGPLSLFQSADITFLASLVFGSFGFGATELFRRSFTATFFNVSGGSDSGSEVILLLAAALATVVTAAFATPFEVLRVRSMGLLEPTKWTNVLQDFLGDNSSNKGENGGEKEEDEEFELRKLKPRELLPLWGGFAPTLSRELPFSIAKFLTFDLIATALVAFLNADQGSEGALPIQVGVGPVGLAISAFSGAVAGIAGAIVSHPADLILTKTSAAKRSNTADKEPTSATTTTEEGVVAEGDDEDETPDWRRVVNELIGKEGGIANLFVGIGARSVFFFLVIGLQFFLYDYVKNLFQVGSEDLNLVLDVFYSVRAGLPE